jgi:hypothetical protein
MTVHVDEVVSEIKPEREPGGAAPTEHWSWDEVERFEAARTRAAQYAERTRAEAFDD